MRLLPTALAARQLHLHRNTLHRYRKDGLLKGGTHWFRQGPSRNARYLYDVDACQELFKQWALEPPERLLIINCTKLHRAERDLQGDVVQVNVPQYVENDE